MTRREWFKTLPKEVSAKAIANSSKEQLDTPKNSLYEALCDGDGFQPEDTPEGYDYWDKVANKVWNDQQKTKRKMAMN